MGETRKYKGKLEFSTPVLEFEPDIITDSSLWKYCDELSVMSALIHFFPNKYLNLTHADRPDLQITNEIGIEVTQCLDADYNASIGVWTSLNAGKKGKTLDKVKKKIAEHGGELNDFFLLHKTQDEQSQMVPIKRGIDVKISKLPFYRTQFKECSLAIILEEPIRTIPQLSLEYFLEKQKESEIRFDQFMILANRFLMIYDYETRLITKIELSKEEKRNIDYSAVMVANGLISDIKECFNL